MKTWINISCTLLSSTNCAIVRNKGNNHGQSPAQHPHNIKQTVKLIEINMGQCIDLNGGRPVTYAGHWHRSSSCPKPLPFSRQLKTPHPSNSTSMIFILPHRDPRAVISPCSRQPVVMDNVSPTSCPSSTKEGSAFDDARGYTWVMSASRGHWAIYKTKVEMCRGEKSR